MVAIKLKDFDGLTKISDQRWIVGKSSDPSLGSTDSQADTTSNHYYDDPITVARAEGEAETKVNGACILPGVFICQLT